VRHRRNMSERRSGDLTRKRDVDPASDLCRPQHFNACHGMLQSRRRPRCSVIAYSQTVAQNRTLLRPPIPPEVLAMPGPVSRLPKSEWWFRIARYPKIDVETVLSENYCEQVIQCERKGNPSKLCLGSTPRAKGESIVRILGASQRKSQTSRNCQAHSTALTHRNPAFDASGRAAAIHFFNPSGGNSD